MSLLSVPPPSQHAQSGGPSCEGMGLVLFTAVPEMREEGRQEWMKEGMNVCGTVAAKTLLGSRWQSPN